MYRTLTDYVKTLLETDNKLLGIRGRLLNMDTSFGEWLNQELELRGWSQSEAARRGGVAPSTIQQVVSGTTQPGPKLCKAVARAFGMPEEEVFRRAGLLPMPPNTTVDDQRSLQEFVKKFRRLSLEDKRYVIDLVNRLNSGASVDEP